MLWTADAPPRRPPLVRRHLRRGLGLLHADLSPRQALNRAGLRRCLHRLLGGLRRLAPIGRAESKGPDPGKLTPQHTPRICSWGSSPQVSEILRSSARRTTRMSLTSCWPLRTRHQTIDAHAADSALIYALLLHAAHIDPLSQSLPPASLDMGSHGAHTYSNDSNACNSN